MLVHLRLLLGWPKEDLAAAAGLHPATLSLLENGKRPLTYPALAEIAAAARVSAPLLERLVSFNAAARLALSAGGSPEALAAGAEDLALELGYRFSETGVAVARSILAELPAFAAERPEAAASPPYPEDRETGEELWAALEGNPATGRLLVEATREYRNWALCRRVCDESLAAVGDPARALELADLARVIAELAPGEEPWRWRLQGYSWAHLASAHGLQGQLPEADRAFTRAKELWQAGEPGDPGRLLDEARMLDLKAGLRRS